MNILDNYGKSGHAECTLALSQPLQTVIVGAIERRMGNLGNWTHSPIVEANEVLQLKERFLQLS